MSDQPTPDAGELRAVLGQLMRKLRSKSEFGDYTHSQAAVLTRLERDGPATISDLARAEGVRPQSMAATIAALTEAGYVEGTADQNDGRKTLQSLTAHARSLVASGRLAKEDWLIKTIRTTLDADEQRLLASSVPLLRRLAESP
ncbi:MarR family winged helix-turn-helix transcriptional regulator [Subtercola sp. YIM 133946]|uniref:MarR family winged helix-turn-helix transcriptional regulator n=1 Tax=Subtercola sp. YIM 133946 TaxID=3118909 RepID=UPI002F93A632